MPLPLILGIAAGAAAIAGIGSGVHGAVKMKEANDTIKDAQERHQKNLGKFEYENQKTDTEMDKVGEKELQILKSFETFSNYFEKNPQPSFFRPYRCQRIHLANIRLENVKKCFRRRECPFLAACLVLQQVQQADLLLQVLPRPP